MRTIKLLNRLLVAAAVVSAASWVGGNGAIHAQPQDPAQQQPPPKTDPPKTDPQKADPQKADPQKADPQKQKPQKPKPDPAQPQRGTPPPQPQRASPPPQGQPQRGQPQQSEPQRGQGQPQRGQGEPQRGQSQQGQPQRGQSQRGQSQGQAETRQGSRRLPPPQQQALIGQQQQRLTQYGAHLDLQLRSAPQQIGQLQRQNRTMQYGIQLQYLSNLRDQQRRIQTFRGYDYWSDPYFYTPASYRYMRGGRYYETNDYGANLLRQAVNYGYEQGFRAGRADREDRWSPNYQDSYAFQDGSYGYEGFYVDPDEYAYYFREGFRRGYDDGYYSRFVYGSYSTGTSSSGRYGILPSALTVILHLEIIR